MLRETSPVLLGSVVVRGVPLHDDRAARRILDRRGDPVVSDRRHLELRSHPVERLPVAIVPALIVLGSKFCHRRDSQAGQALHYHPI